MENDKERPHSEQKAAVSRLCVKGIPKYVNEARLKEFFSAKGEVTDVKVLKTR
jgi:multiple RNA-binding domain-containing protein 1